MKKTKNKKKTFYIYAYLNWWIDCTNGNILKFIGHGWEHDILFI